MNFTGFLHENTLRFAYPVSESELHIRLRTGAGDAESVTLLIIDPYDWVKAGGKYVLNTETLRYLPMKREYAVYGFDWWFVPAEVPTKRAKYAFIAEKDGRRYFYGDGGHTIKEFDAGADISDLTPEMFIFPYILKEDLFDAPEWAKDTVWYQIFPDRFTGNIPGITSKLDYLKDLGMTGIYLTPIFTSPSAHKYDTEDYFQIDPAFGTSADLLELVSEAHSRNIKIMLDLVFNHIGSTNPLWKDAVKKGRDSAYYDWFYIKDDGSYETFGNVKRMPKWNTSNSGARAYLIGAAAYWARTYGVDGYRLDVANEVSYDFWREFRKEMRKINPALYIVGEVWDTAVSRLGGDMFDTVMNYKFYSAACNFVSGKTDGRGLADALGEYLTAYPKNRQEVMFNLIGSHDTSRILTVAGGDVNRAAQAFALLLTMGGSPCVFYGDEAGFEGENPDEARKPMIWGDDAHNTELLAFVKKMTALRAQCPALREADIDIRYAGAEGIIYLKRAGDDAVLVALETAPGSLIESVEKIAEEKGGVYENVEEISLDYPLVCIRGLRRKKGNCN